MSVYTDLCDNIMEELTSSVPELAACATHRYTPFSVENLVADGQKHLAVWVAPEDANQEETFALATMTSLVRHALVVAYWEPSDEGDYHAADEAAAARLLDLLERSRARFFDESFRARPPAYRTDWVAAASGMGGAQTGGLVRWWAAEVAVWVPVDHTG